MDVAGTQLVEKDIENLARGEAGGCGAGGGVGGRLAGPPGLSPQLEVFAFSAGVINSCD